MTVLGQKRFYQTFQLSIFQIFNKNVLSSVAFRVQNMDIKKVEMFRHLHFALQDGLEPTTP